MLEVSLHEVGFRYRTGGFAIDGLTLTFPRGTHTILAGAAGSGSSTILRLVSGELRAETGEIRIGARVVNRISLARRPLLAVTSDPDIPGRWSVQHALVAAVSLRSLDREDRRREYAYVLGRYELEPLLQRPVRSLSSTERCRVHLARIELLRPALLIADRLMAGVNPSDRAGLADRIYRNLRAAGATVISAPASTSEIAHASSVVVLDRGTVAEQSTPAALYASPRTEAGARATGAVNAIPVVIRGASVESPIGSWEVENPPFEGTGIALARPDDFQPAGPGDESDFVFGVEEAGFAEGRWLARGILTGGFMLEIALPATLMLHKGKLLALRYDPRRFLLVRSEHAASPGVPTDVIPPMSESR